MNIVYQYEPEIAALLMCIGINNSGYNYFKMALLVRLAPCQKKLTVSEIYKHVTKHFSVSSNTVEHNMRLSVSRAHKSNMLQNFNALIGQRVICLRPTVSYLIEVLSEYLRLFKNCNCDII